MISIRHKGLTSTTSLLAMTGLLTWGATGALAQPSSTAPEATLKAHPRSEALPERVTVTRLDDGSQRVSIRGAAIDPAVRYAEVYAVDLERGLYGSKRILLEEISPSELVPHVGSLGEALYELAAMGFDLPSLEDQLTELLEPSATSLLRQGLAVKPSKSFDYDTECELCSGYVQLKGSVSTTVASGVVARVELNQLWGRYNFFGCEVVNTGFGACFQPASGWQRTSCQQQFTPAREIEGFARVVGNYSNLDLGDPQGTTAFGLILETSRTPLGIDFDADFLAIGEFSSTFSALVVPMTADTCSLQ